MSRAEELRFPTHDGQEGRAVLGRPATGGTGTLVLVTHGGNGVPDDARALVDLLVGRGATAVAVDATARLPEGELSPDDVDRLRSRSHHELVVADLRSAATHVELERSAAFDHVAVVGFCGGGLIGAWLAAEWPRVEALVALHAAPRFPPERNSARDPKPDLADVATRLTCTVQLHCGGADPYVPVADVEEMVAALRERGLDPEVHWYPGRGHGWCDPTADTHDAADAALALGRVADLVTSL